MAEVTRRRGRECGGCDDRHERPSSPCPPSCPTGPTGPGGSGGPTGPTGPATSSTGPTGPTGPFPRPAAPPLSAQFANAADTALQGDGEFLNLSPGQINVGPAGFFTYGDPTLGVPPTIGVHRVDQIAGSVPWLVLRTSLFGGADIPIVSLSNAFFQLGTNGFATLVFGTPIDVRGGTASAVAGAELSLAAQTWLGRSALKETTNASHVLRTDRGDGSSNEQTDYGPKVHTPNATPVVIYTGPIPLGVSSFRANVNAIEPGIASAVFNVITRFTNFSGTITQGAVTTLYSSIEAGLAGISIAVSFSGTNWTITVTGLAGTGIDWTPTVTWLNDN
jgi:hypothetical protein